MSDNKNIFEEHILLVGCGGREHAIAKSILKESENLKNINLYCVGNYKNPGIEKLIGVDNYYILDIIDKNYNSILEFCKKKDISYAIIGAEGPLGDGLSDFLNLSNIKCIGPLQSYAKIEWDKNFARSLMMDYGLKKYNPRYKLFSPNLLESLDCSKLFYETIESFGNYVIKPVGLCGGKGVKIYGEHFTKHQDALDYLESIIKTGMSVLVEEKLIGKEFSLMSFCDGKTLAHMPPVVDFKRAYNNNQGPNTGSMGSVSYSDHSLPFLTSDDVYEAEGVNEIIIKALDYHNLMNNTDYRETTGKIGYRGIIYGSFMMTKRGLRVIEFNARFGDPECINILSILSTDINKIFSAINTQTLGLIKDQIEYRKESSLLLYLVPSGYPENPQKGCEISFNERIDIDNLIFASVYRENEKYLLKGSRAIGIIVNHKSNNLKILNDIALEKAIFINGPVRYRSDIGVFEITYQNCGVDINEVTKTLEIVKGKIKSTHNDNVISNYGGFGGLLTLENIIADGDNTLVTTIDGVGTKTSFLPDVFGDVAYYIMGQDIVGHCINDILVQNAQPLFFMDYIASSKLDSNKMKLIIDGIVDVCRKHNCVLIGGETAEMPGVYRDNAYDIVGTMIGSVNQEKIIDGKTNVKAGDIVLSLPSNNIHTNGYTMIRKIFEINDITEEPDLMDWMSKPHKPYYNEITTLLNNGINIHALCHITGGGLIDNPPRVLPDNLKMIIDYNYECNPMFQRIKELGNISNQEMFRTFNCGIGMMVIVAPEDETTVIDLIFNNYGINCTRCGIIKDKEKDIDNSVYINIVS